MASFQFQPINQAQPQNLYPPPDSHASSGIASSPGSGILPAYSALYASTTDIRLRYPATYLRIFNREPASSAAATGIPTGSDGRLSTISASAAVADLRHQYPTQPTYAAANGNIPSSPNLPQGQYVSPPLPPRPATTQPQFFAGFTSQNVVAYPPPPKRVFSPPPAAPPQPPRRQSGGTSSGRLFSSSSALKWIDKTGKGLENKLDAPPRPS
ncbi:hypothetical protein TrVGV298_009157 [Trichoderma virens]|nr:hypothetical protein TrVGV298_009157 [Trichoderma virens]